MLSQPVSNEFQALLEAAVLAPSSHNTQPWLFRIIDSRVLLLADRTRALPVNDPEDRELVISCGAALFNLRVAAAKFGLTSTTKILPTPDDVDLLAVVELGAGPPVAHKQAELYPQIFRRRTYRKRFDNRPIPESVLAEITGAAAGEGACLSAVSEDVARHEVTMLIAEGDTRQWADRAWRRELAAWMHPRREGDGLTVPGIVVPIAQSVIRTFDMGGGVGAKDRQLAEGSPVLALLSTTADGPADWLKAGQALQKLLLTACRMGLQASYLNQPIQTASLRPKLRQATATSSFPQILIRMGFPTENLPPAPRRRTSDVTERV